MNSWVDCCGILKNSIHVPARIVWSRVQSTKQVLTESFQRAIIALLNEFFAYIYLITIDICCIHSTSIHLPQQYFSQKFALFLRLDLWSQTQTQCSLFFQLLVGSYTLLLLLRARLFAIRCSLSLRSFSLVSLLCYFVNQLTVNKHKYFP